MYRYAKSVDWCQCCQQGVSLADAQGSSDFLRNNDSSQIVHSSDNASCFHSISFSFSVGVDAHIDPRADVGIRPYNNFTNYDAIICKKEKIILACLLFDSLMLS